MSELGETMHKLHLAKEGGAISGEVIRLDAFGSFHTGWIGQPFIYENPELYITCETDFGEIQLQVQISSYSESGLEQFLQNAPMISFNPPETIDLTNLIGETIYIAPDEDKLNTTIGWTSDVSHTGIGNIVFRSDSNLKNLDAIDGMGRTETGTEPRSIEWMNHLITVEHICHTQGKNGWLQVPFTYVGETDTHHFFTATLPTGKKLHWAFETNLSGVESIDAFLSQIDIEYTPEEFDNETIWVKPMRTLEPHNKDDKTTCLDTTEFWMASGSPKPPEKTKTIVEKLKSLIPTPRKQIGVSVETSSRSRRAKSSHKKETPTPPTQETEKQPVLTEAK